ncbi:CPXCG motif-containing cysteine-rich protein [soil metagenome]
MQPFVDIHCPYCGERIAVAVDDSAGEQAYIEDCQVCCRPIEISVAFDGDGTPAVFARGENEA